MEFLSDVVVVAGKAGSPRHARIDFPILATATAVRSPAVYNSDIATAGRDECAGNEQSAPQ
jgi:hypothetical protein